MGIIKAIKEESGMFEKHSESGYRLVLEGIEQKTLVYGDKTLMTKFC